MGWSVTRRDAVRALAAGVSGIALLAPNAANGAAAFRRELRIDLAPKFELSPYLFLQFMEPLGVTDGSVEAAWDHQRDDWRADVVEVTREVGPTMVRRGGIFTHFYRWREGVGPREGRRSRVDGVRGGVESHQNRTGDVYTFA